ncbi:uncharacterized protein LOC110307336 [Mus caroli]|uniref:Uncharacterized protein LOC110307336 n=1 Tax=Mus caroli TaxID=10089 RepID=A0A6P5R0I5_MUSCR|nr:uncharacterized protein LOC110307336 [Mus caroli]
MPLLQRKKRTLETLNISSSPRRTGDEATAVIDTKQVRSDNTETPSSLAENILLNCTSVCYSELLTRTVTSSLQPTSALKPSTTAEDICTILLNFQGYEVLETLVFINYLF